MNKNLCQRVVSRSGLKVHRAAVSAFATRLGSLRRFAALLTSCLLCLATVAQNGNVAYPENSIDSRLRTDAHVDPTTGALQLKISLGKYPGRGDADLPITLYYSSKLWRLEHLSTVGGPTPDGMYYPYDSVYGAFYADNSAAGWTSNLDWFIWPSTDNFIQTYDAWGRPADGSGRYTQARRSVRLPDGSKHELRRDDTVWDIFSNYNEAGVYYAVDGSRLRYETATQTLYMPDGSRIVGDTQFVDRHGNRLTYDWPTRTWSDTLGRQFGLPLPDFSTTGEQYSAQARDEYYNVPGYNGAPRTYTFRWRRLADVRTDPSQPLLSKGDRVARYSCEVVPSLFTSPVQCAWDDDHRLMSTSPFNPVVLHQIAYPDGSTYTFTYNAYGEIDKIVYPWGGYEKFTYGPFPTLSSHFNSDAVSTFYMQGNRGVTQRRVSADGTQAGEVTWTYTGGTTNRVTAPDGTVTERRLFASAGVTVAFGFDDPRAGLTYDERVYAHDGGPMLRRKLTEWQVDGTVQYHDWRVMYKTRNPRPLKEVEVLLDTGGNALASTTTYTYDSDQNATSTNKYAFVEVDQGTAQNGAIGSFPSGALLRREETDYLTYDQNYRARNLLSLPTATRVKDASGAIISHTETRYDEPAYAPLPCGASTGWSDPGTGARGNATTTRWWLDTNNTWVEEHAQYDGCGSLRRSWDASGNLSQTDYSASYQFAYPTQATSPAPDPTGQYGSASPLVTTTAYDFSTGLVTSTTDANNQTTTFEYNDPLDRLTRVNRPDGGRTTNAYVAAHQCGPHVETRTLLDSAGRETSETRFFDPAGRIKRVLRYDPQDAAQPYLTVDTQYDAMGRVWRISNQYRSAGCWAGVNPSGRWTENTYDKLGRVTQVRTTADNASVTTAYSGNQVTVTDQAGKSQRSVTDALGRLAQVVEDPSGLAYVSNYTYDALGGLRRVEQGGQFRFFMYDSLGRLTRARNPEQGVNPSIGGTDPLTGNGQWSYSYAYDADGNLLTRVDPRNVTTGYAYDALGRNTYVSYSDSTPHVKLVYDTAANGRGLLRGNWTLTASGTHLTHTAVDNYDALGRPLNRRQHFYTNNVAGPAFTTQRTYDLAGNVVTQSYPSGRSVSYGYDGAGRLSAFAGNLGDGVQRTYASELRYHEYGAREQERFGTQTPVYNKHFYNVRAQLAEIRVSTYPITSPGNETNWNRGAILNHYSQAVWGGSDQFNNGNVMTQQVWIPNDDAISGWDLFEHSYTYDALNRLRRVREGDRWQQTFDYDRWGNRTVNAAETWDNEPWWDVPEPQFTASSATNRLQPPPGHTMQYDAAGNLTYDDYTGWGPRGYDAENRMTSAQFVSGQAQTATYAYDADGQRVKRNLGAGGEVWQVYGVDGELLAEYAAGAQPNAPQREYGYRSGQLLVTTVAPQSGGSGLTAQYFDNIDFSGPSLTRVDPTLNFDWGGGTPHQSIGVDEFSARWTGSVQPLYSETYTFYTVSDDGIRLWVNNQLVIDRWVDQAPTEWSGQIWLQAGQRYDIRVEFFERFGGATAKLLWSSPSQPKEVVPQGRLFPAGGVIQWLVADHLGSPRMVVDQSGSLSGLTRRDFFPFGEEIPGDPSRRSAARGYVGDAVRQKFTSKERDAETGLDYFLARYYSPRQGRFASVDPENAGSDVSDPQSWNGYAYGRNNPVMFVDPDGLEYKVCDNTGKCWTHWDPHWKPVLKDAGAAKRDGVTFQGNMNSGKILDAEGNQIGTYQWVGQDYWSNATNRLMYRELPRRMAPVKKVVEVEAEILTTFLPGGRLLSAFKLGKVGLNLLRKYCFVAGTPVLTGDGLKPIEEIKAGDEVLSYNEQTGQNEYKRVVRTFVNDADEILSLHVEGEAVPLGVTPEHPFYARAHRARDALPGDEADGAEWAPADALRPGDEIRLASGGWARVLRVERHGGGTPVYNFEVADNHNYFVGRSALLAHNACIPRVANRKLQNIVSDLYKGARSKHPIGTGNTADAVRYERATGKPVGGKWHTKKAQDYVRALENWLNDYPGASDHDKMVARSLLSDLKSALAGK